MARSDTGECVAQLDGNIGIYEPLVGIALDTPYWSHVGYKNIAICNLLENDSCKIR